MSRSSCLSACCLAPAALTRYDSDMNPRVLLMALGFVLGVAGVNGADALVRRTSFEIGDSWGGTAISGSVESDTNDAYHKYDGVVGLDLWGNGHAGVLEMAPTATSPGTLYEMRAYLKQPGEPYLHDEEFFLTAIDGASSNVLAKTDPLLASEHPHWRVSTLRFRAGSASVRLRIGNCTSPEISKPGAGPMLDIVELWAIDETGPAFTDNSTDEVLPPITKPNVVLFTHGWLTTAADFNSPTSQWGRLRAALEARVAELPEAERTDWQVVGVCWSKHNGSTDSILPYISATFYPQFAANNARILGEKLGAVLRRAPGLRKVHFIAHSAGAWMIDTASRWPTPGAEKQLTFLDAYSPPAAMWYSKSFGFSADWSEHFYDTRQDPFGWTKQPFGGCLNVDVTEADNIPGDAHGLPLEWYVRTIEQIPSAPALGFAYSLLRGNRYSFPAAIGTNSFSRGEVTNLTAVALGESPFAGYHFGALSTWDGSQFHVDGTTVFDGTGSVDCTSPSSTFRVGLRITGASNHLVIPVAAYSEGDLLVEIDGILAALQHVQNGFSGNLEFSLVPSRVTGSRSLAIRFVAAPAAVGEVGAADPVVARIGLPLIGVMDADSDGDGQSDSAEGEAGTDPFDPADLLKCTLASPISLEVQTVSGRSYSIESSTDLMTWTKTAEILNSSGGVQSVTLPASSNAKLFHRARLR